MSRLGPPDIDGKTDVINLQTQRTKILTQILALGHISTKSEDIHRLQQEYNVLSQHITDIEQPSFLDPIQALPLELWAKIITRLSMTSILWMIYWI